MQEINTVVPGFRVLGFSALPGFRALKAGDGAWSVHKTLFGFRAPLFSALKKISFQNSRISRLKSRKSPSNSSKNSKKIINQEPKIGALNPNSVLCTDQAPSPAFSALNPGSPLNPRTLNPGTTVCTYFQSFIVVLQLCNVS